MLMTLQYIEELLLMEHCGFTVGTNSRNTLGYEFKTTSKCVLRNIVYIDKNAGTYVVSKYLQLDFYECLCPLPQPQLAY
jgi:hypothetical protein